MFLALFSTPLQRIWRSLFSRHPLKNFRILHLTPLKIKSTFIIPFFFSMWCEASAWQGTFQDFFTFTSGGLNCHGGENVHLNCIFFILGGFQQRRHWASLHIDFTCLLVESSRDLTWHQDDHCCLLIRPSFSQVCNAEVKFPDLSCFRAKLYLFSAHFHIKKK